MTAILEARGLVKHFGGGRSFMKAQPVVRAVDGVSLSIRRGETFAIVGESGCGKSTLARLILRLIEPTAGEVVFDGQAVTGAGPEALRRLRRDMQLVFQDPYSSLNPRMSVGDLIAEPIRVHAIVPAQDVAAKVAETLALVGLLPEHANRYPHEFSGGQRQRIGLARALASAPKLLIGDEPVSALDVSIRAQILNLMEDLKERLGLTLILVSHDLAVVRHSADRVAVMYLGRIVETAPVNALFDRPMHPYTRALLAAIPKPDPTLRSERPLLEGDPPSPSAPPPGCHFHTRCPYATAVCRAEVPVLEARTLHDAEPEHLTACHHAEAIASAERPAVISTTDGAIRRQRVALFATAAAARAATPTPERPTP